MVGWRRIMIGTIGAVGCRPRIGGLRRRVVERHPRSAHRRPGPAIHVVTTVAPITSIAAAVIGDNAEITGIVPEGTNSHTFEPRPSDAEALETADVVFVNGLQLEEPTKELAEEVTRDGTPIIELADRTVTEDEWIYDFSFPEEEGKPNPHLWTNPPMAERYAEIIRDEMIELDPANQAEYEANTAAFVGQVDEFDACPAHARSPPSRPRTASCSPTTTPTPTSPTTTASR